jgi:plasmid stabilization system protein ParE
MDKIRILPSATEDLEAALAWYDQRSISTANRFAGEVDKAIKSIAAHPTRYPLLDDKHRYVRLNRFPYYVAYRLLTDRIQIVGIRHTSRRPLD